MDLLHSGFGAVFVEPDAQSHINRAVCVFWLANHALSYEAANATLAMNSGCNTQYRFAARCRAVTTQCATDVKRCEMNVKL